jgi:hypothetical protein
VSVAETIVWQILEPLNRKVLFTATTQGNGHDTGIYADAQLHALYGAFYDAAQQVLAMPEFRQAVMRPP